MSRNRSRRANRKKPSSPRPAIQAVRSASPSPIAGSHPKRGFHIDWTQVNFWQFIILLLIPIVLTILYVFPILDKHKQLRPEATIIAGSFLTTIGIVYGVLSAGVFRIKKINPFHPKKFKPNQAVLAIISGILLSFLLLEIAMLPPPPQSIAHSGPPLTTLPLLPFGGAPPYKGVLVMDGMQSKPSSKYFWEQRTDGKASCKFVGSTFYISTTKQDSLELCQAVNTDFHNFAFEIDMSFDKPGTAIIYFRYTSQISYQIIIQSVENFAELSLLTVSFLANGQLRHTDLIKPITIIDRDQRAPVDFSSGIINHIGVVAIDQNLTIYVNGKSAQGFHVTDDSSSHGAIAVGAFTPSSQTDTETEIEFSNARVWTI